MRARERVCTYGIPVAIGPRHRLQCPADDANCSGTPSGECMVGRCWEACSSWVSRRIYKLSFYGGHSNTKSVGYYTGGPVNTQAASFRGDTGESIFQVRHGDSLEKFVIVDGGILPTTQQIHGLSTTPLIFSRYY